MGGMELQCDVPLELQIPFQELSQTTLLLPSHLDRMPSKLDRAVRLRSGTVAGTRPIWRRLHSWFKVA